MSHGPTISVVVMGYRNAATIVDAVRSVVAQGDDGVEVVVVTSGGDASAARVRAAFPDLVVVESGERLYPGAARNAGVAATSGDVVAFLAADCVAEPGWVAGRRRAHGAGHPVVASAITNAARGSLPAWGFHFDLYADRLAGHPAREVRGGVAAAHGCSFDRAVLDEAGPFDETLRFGEDTDIVRRLERRGVPIWFEPAVRTAHAGPRTTTALIREQLRRGGRRGRWLGPAASGLRGWIGLGRYLLRRVGRGWRGAGPDRVWFWASLPWAVLSRVSALVGQQRAARRADPWRDDD